MVEIKLSVENFTRILEALIVTASISPNSKKENYLNIHSNICNQAVFQLPDDFAQAIVISQVRSMLNK